MIYNKINAVKFFFKKNVAGIKKCSIFAPQFVTE